MTWPFDPLPLFGFDLVVADPPWPFELRSKKGEKKSQMAQYECMPMGEIAALPVDQLVGMHSWLLLWVPAPLLPDGLRVMTAWGFRYKTTIAWRKTTRTGKVRVGPGYIARTMHEIVLVGALGSPRLSRALPSLFDGLAREHSRKPDEFYAIVEKFAPDARCVDLFSRQSRRGWATWGDQSCRFDAEAA